MFNPKNAPKEGVTSLAGQTPILFLLILATLFILIAPVNAQNGTDGVYNLTAFPERVAEHMQISLFASQLLCTGIVLLLGIIPTTIIARSKKSSWIPEIAVTVILLGFSVGIGWLNVFFIVAICFLIALMFASGMRKWVTGR